MSAPVFGVFFVGSSYPVTDSNFVRTDATHWVRDWSVDLALHMQENAERNTSSLSCSCWMSEQQSLEITQSSKKWLSFLLSPTCSLQARLLACTSLCLVNGRLVTHRKHLRASSWLQSYDDSLPALCNVKRALTLVMVQWRGFVSNEHPSEVMPLQWPEVSGGSLTGTNHPAVQLGVSLEPLGEIRASFCGSWKHPKQDQHTSLHAALIQTPEQSSQYLRSQHLSIEISASEHLSKLWPGASVKCRFTQDPLLNPFNLALYSHPGCAVRALHNTVVGDLIYM